MGNSCCAQKTISQMAELITSNPQPKTSQELGSLSPIPINTHNREKSWITVFEVETSFEASILNLAEKSSWDFVGDSTIEYVDQSINKWQIKNSVQNQEVLRSSEIIEEESQFSEIVPDEDIYVRI